MSRQKKCDITPVLLKIPHDNILQTSQFSILCPKTSQWPAKIFVTPRSKIGNQAIVVASVKAGESFTISLDHALSLDAKFDWWIVESK